MSETVPTINRVAVVVEPRGVNHVLNDTSRSTCAGVISPRPCNRAFKGQFGASACRVGRSRNTGIHRIGSPIKSR